MKITEKVLEQLGCEKKGDDTWVLKMWGYRFYFVKHVDKFVNHGKPTWTFYSNEEEYKNGWNPHSPTDIEECFGAIAQDYIRFGKEERNEEFKAMLEGQDL